MMPTDRKDDSVIPPPIALNEVKSCHSAAANPCGCRDSGLRFAKGSRLRGFSSCQPSAGAHVQCGSPCLVSIVTRKQAASFSLRTVGRPAVLGVTLQPRSPLGYSKSQTCPFG